MMTGIVTARYEAVLRLTIRAANGQDYPYDAVIDTGYTGNLTLTTALIAMLGLQWHRYGSAILADGSVSQFNVYKGVVLWDGQPLPITIDEIDADSLIGMSLMYDYELNLPVRVGATFTLRPIASP